MPCPAESLVSLPEQWLARACTGMPAPLLIADRDGRIIYSNQAAVALLSDVRRLQGRRIEDLLPDSGGTDRLTANERRWRAVLPRGDESTQEVEVRGAPFSGPDDSWVYVLFDVTHDAELGRLREQLLYSTAHELRGHITSLIIALEALDERFDSLTVEDCARLVRDARTATVRLRWLVGSLLSAGAIRSGHFVVTPRATPLATMIDEAIREVTPVLDRRGQRVVRAAPADDTMAMADEAHVIRVLTNLLMNASKYGPIDHDIHLSVRCAGDHAVIAVSDDGPGIEVEHQARLFDRFYRAQPTAQAPGVGLGLAIAKGIVEAHGGTIGIDSAPGRGATVWFTLPLPPTLTPAT